MSEESVRLLLVEDDEDDYLLTRDHLEQIKGRSYDLDWADSYERGLEKLAADRYDACLFDFRLGPASGLDLLREAQARRIKAPVIILTGLGDYDADVEAMRAGAMDYLVKGELTPQLLDRSIRYSIARRRAEVHLEEALAETEFRVEERTRALRAANAALRRRERELDSLVRNVPDVITRFDRRLRRVFANPALEEMSGLPLAALLGRPVGDPPDSTMAKGATELAEALERAFVTGEPTTLEQAIDSPAGLRVLHTRVTPEFNDEGEAETLLAVSRDITDLKRLEGELRAAKEAAEAANRAKSDFLARMSHEIRTPMNGVLGMTELALMSGPMPEARNYLLMVRQSAASLLDIINDILDLSKIEAGKLELEPADFDARKLLDMILPALSLAAAEKGLRLTHFVDEAVPGRLRGDPVRLRQVLVNLVGNAVKFTDQGEASVSLELADAREDGGAVLRFRIEDTGVGIPADKLETVFESFTQLGPDQAGQRGTGLGLAISKQLVELMGGTIEAASLPGRGSRFTVVLPFDPPAGEAEPKAAAREPEPEVGGLRPLRLLLAEDNPVNRLLAATLLERRGHAVTAVTNGREALEALARERFDAALMDVRMPEMNGLEATRIIRTEPPSGVDPGIPIIALTAHALKGDRERFLAAGMDDYVSKPIDPSELELALRRVQAALQADGLERSSEQRGQGR